MDATGLRDAHTPGLRDGRAAGTCDARGAGLDGHAAGLAGHAAGLDGHAAGLAGHAAGLLAGHAAGLLAALAPIVAEGPERVALVDPHGTYTYGELWRWAGAVATWLKGQGIDRGDLVGLATPRSAAHVAAILGVWWAGAAFVPLPPELPPERRRSIEADAAPAILLDAAMLRRLRDRGPAALDRAPADATISPADLDERGRPSAGSSAAAQSTPRGASTRLDASVDAPACPDADDLAYVIFTSGSSGRPKGVRIAHRGIVPLLRAQIAAFRHHPATRALFVLSPAFDAAISDIGTVLLAGGTLVIPGDDLLRDPEALLAALTCERITAIDLPPALLRHLDHHGVPPTLETVVLGGEPSPPELVRRLAARVRVVNVYGPTEATVCVSLCECDAVGWDRPLLGDPLPGVGFHVLGDDGAILLVCEGIEGELAISGPCLALGYLDRPEEDAARFLERDGLRLYRSGDRVRVLSGGRLEFRGRLDRQRKVGGVRVELDEIEGALVSHPSVGEAAVDLDAVGRLTALVTPRDRARVLEIADLQQHLAGRLAAAARPRRILVVEALPRGVSGKLDRPAIARAFGLDESVIRDGGSSGSASSWSRGGEGDPDAASTREGDPEVAPTRGGEPDAASPCKREPARDLLEALWRRVLGVDEVRDGDRFTDLGGGSFAALELVALADAVGLVVSAPRLLGDATFAAIVDELGDPPGSIRAVAELQADVDARLTGLLAGHDSLCPERHVFTNMSHGTKTILLTGATGSLGGVVLRELADRHDGAILCLVRARDPAAALVRLRAALGPSPRAEVVPLVGDLAAPHLGLDDAAWRRLTDRVDHIVHAGALVHLARGYEDHRPANLDGTATILELAAGAGAGLHDVSTLSVFVAALPAPDDGDVRCPAEDDPLDGIDALVGGYAQSKWAAERLVRAFAPGRLRATILRPGLVVGARDPGREQLTLLLRGLAELGVVPRGHQALRVDLTPVDVVARGLVALVLEDMSLRTARTSILETLHLAAPRPASAAELVDALRRRGRVIREVDPPTWRALARDRAARSPAAAVAYLALGRALGGGARGPLRPYDLFQATGFALAGPKGAAALARHGLRIPEVTPERLDALVADALAAEGLR